MYKIVIAIGAVYPESYPYTLCNGEVVYYRDIKPIHIPETFLSLAPAEERCVHFRKLGYWATPSPL